MVLYTDVHTVQYKYGLCCSWESQLKPDCHLHSLVLLPSPWFLLCYDNDSLVSVRTVAVGGEKYGDSTEDTSGFYYGSLFLGIMGLCLNSNLKLPNMWKYTSLLSLVKLDLKLKKVRLFPFLESVKGEVNCRLTGKFKQIQEEEEIMNPCCQSWRCNLVFYEVPGWR